MKRFVSILLASLITLTAFGASAVFGGALGANAIFFDYYEYTPFPGLDAFGAADFALAWMPRASYAGSSGACLPAGGGVEAVQSFTVTGADAWGCSAVSSVRLRNTAPENNTQGVELDSPNWAAKDKLNGKDIFGDTGLTFADSQGFCFWVGLNGGAFAGTAKVTIYNVPARGPFYIASEDGSTDMSGYGIGSVYETDMIRPDEDGYFYFDFKTDYKQVDWWTTDEDGLNPFGMGKYPVPQSLIARLNGFQITFSGLQTGDTVYIGGWRMYKDTRLHLDELEEQCAAYDALDPEAYTEETYAAASEVYLRAYEMLLDHTGCEQREINAMAVELKRAIKALKPMFKAVKDDVKLAGFEVWTDDDFDEIMNGGVCFDTAAVEDENVPKNRDQSVMILAQPLDGEPLYGYSCFTNAVEDGAVKNPFEPLEGSEPLSSAAGIRFWIKWGEAMAGGPQGFRVGLGVSSEDLYFESEDGSFALPESEGYIGVPWSAFYDVDGDEDVYGRIDEFDTIYIYLGQTAGVYYIADLGGFMWSTSSADFGPLKAKIAETEAYLATLDRSEYTINSWNRILSAIDDGRALLGVYGATEEAVGDAIEEIDHAVRRLTYVGVAPTPEVVARLEALYKCGAACWRGNVTSASYRELKWALEQAEDTLEYGGSLRAFNAIIERLDAAIAGLVPITAGEKVTSIYSFEDYTTRDLNRATGGSNMVSYSLDSAFDKIPEGYAKALKMTSLEDKSIDDESVNGILQFAAMYREAGTNRVVPLKMGTPEDPKANTLIGDLTGTDGICLWVGVNDMSLIREGTLRFGVSNCEVSPLFERSTLHIPLPASGSGWIYIPWECFERYDEWTHGQEIDLARIYFYVIRFNGEIKRGAEVYVTGIHAYKNVTAGEWEVPAASNIEDGGVYDVSERPLVPAWNAGAAILDGEFFPADTAVEKSGEHTLELINGDKRTTVTFTVTGGEEPPAVKKGDFTGNDKIEVDDALAALRIAAKLAEETPESVLIGDTDGDGHVTVADALAILRVAAKLADESSLG